MKCITLVAFFIVAISSTFAKGPQCNSCITVAEMGKQILTVGISREQLKAIGDLACSMVPVMIQSMCPGLVQTVYKNVYNMIIVKQRTPEDICNEVKLC